MANLVPYKIHLEGSVRKLVVSEAEADGFNGNEPFFVPVTNFYNSVQLVCPFDEYENPIVFDKRKIKVHLKPHISDITGQSLDGIHHVYLLDLYPHKIKICYEKKNYFNYNHFENLINSSSEGEPDDNDSEPEENELEEFFFN